MYVHNSPCTLLINQSTGIVSTGFRTRDLFDVIAHTFLLGGQSLLVVSKRDLIYLFFC